MFTYSIRVKGNRVLELGMLKINFGHNFPFPTVSPPFPFVLAATSFCLLLLSPFPSTESERLLDWTVEWLG